MSTKNIVLFGQSGAGKSSVVNLIAEKKVTKTSLGTERCTMHWEEHLITLNGSTSYKVFDTVGMEDPDLKTEVYLDAIVNAHSLITTLKDTGGIDLLIFCVQAGRITAALQNNYRLFYEWLCEENVPIVLVLTGLEREQRMEDWWNRNEQEFKKYKIKVAGHACITALAPNSLGGSNKKHQQLYEESRRLVRDLIIQHAHGTGAYSGGEAWYRRVMQKLWQSTMCKLKFTPKRKDIETVLTKRCRMTPEVAKELASKIRTDLGGR